MHTAVQAIISVTVENVSTTSATLDCMLPCFSPNLQCNLSNIKTNGVDAMNINVTNGNIVGSVMSYSYPTQRITISNLIDNTTYNYCVVAIDMTNMMKVGETVCGSFITRPLPGTYVRTYVIKTIIQWFRYLLSHAGIRISI